MIFWDREEFKKYEFDKSKFDFYAYLRKSSKNSTQDLSIDTQNRNVKNFITNYTNLDFDIDVNIYMEVNSAFKKKQKINMITGKVEDANIQRPIYKEMMEKIQKTHYKTGKKAIIFLYNPSRLTRNTKDGENIISYLWVDVWERFLHTVPIEKIIFTLDKKEWNYKTDSEIIDKAIANNKAYSKGISNQIKGAIKSKLEDWIIPGDLRVDHNTPFKNVWWKFKVLDIYPKFEKIMTMYKTWNYTQKEICKLLDKNCGIKLSPSRFKEYFKREIWSSYYTNKETGEILEIPFNTEDGKNPMPKHLLEYILMNKKNTGLEYWKWQETDFIAQIFKTEDGRKASFCIPWKDKGKKAIWYNFSNWQNVPFISKFSKKESVVDAVDKFELLKKLLFIYAKMHSLNRIEELKKELEEYLYKRLEKEKVEKKNYLTKKEILEKLENKAILETLEDGEYELIRIIQDENDFLEEVKEILDNKWVKYESKKDFLVNLDYLEIEDLDYLDNCLNADWYFLYLTNELKSFKEILKVDFENRKNKLEPFLFDLFKNNNIVKNAKENIEKAKKWENNILKAELIFNKLDIFKRFWIKKEEKTDKEIKKEYLENQKRILKEQEEKKQNIYNTLYNFFKPYLKNEENKEFIKDTIKEINKQIKEQEEEKNKKIDYCISQELNKDLFLRAIKPFELKIDELKQQKKELENKALDFWDFQFLVNSFEKIFNIIFSLDLRNPWTLTFNELLAKRLISIKDFQEIIKNTTFELILYPSNSIKMEVFEVFNSLVSWFGCGDRNWTCDLRVMSPTRYHFSTPRYKKNFSNNLYSYLKIISF